MTARPLQTTGVTTDNGSGSGTTSSRRAPKLKAAADPELAAQSIRR